MLTVVSLEPHACTKEMTLPPRFADLKASIAASYPDFEKNATRSWAEILRELDEVTKQIKEEGVDVRPCLSLHASFTRAYRRPSAVYPTGEFRRSPEPQ